MLCQYYIYNSYITIGYDRITTRTTRQGAGFAASGHHPVGCCVWLRGASWKSCCAPGILVVKYGKTLNV